MHIYTHKIKHIEMYTHVQAYISVQINLKFYTENMSYYCVENSGYNKVSTDGSKVSFCTDITDETDITNITDLMSMKIDRKQIAYIYTHVLTYMSIQIKFEICYTDKLGLRLCVTAHTTIYVQSNLC